MRRILAFLLVLVMALPSSHVVYAQGDVQETPSSYTEDSDSEISTHETEDDVQETSVTTIEDDVQEASDPIIEDDVQETTDPIIEDDVQETPNPIIEDDVPGVPTPFIEEDIPELPILFTGGAQNEFEADLEVSAEAAEYSVVVPVRLNAYVDASGKIITPSSAKVQNYSSGAVYVKLVNLLLNDDWELTPYDEDFSVIPENTHKVGFHLNGDSTVDSQDGNKLQLSPGAWPMLPGTSSVSSMPISYSLKLPTQTDNLSQVSPLSVIMVVDWYDEFAEERPTAHFDVGGGYMPNHPVLVAGQLATEPSIEPIRNGYEFLGWYSDKGGTQEWDFNNDLVYARTVIYAKWEEVIPPDDNLVTLTLIGENHEVITTTQVPNGTLLSIPTIDIPIEKEIWGWYKDSEYLNYWDFNTEIVTSDLTLYAQIIPRRIHINFSTNCEATDFGRIVDWGDKLTVPEEVINPGFTFGGWYSEPTLTVAWDFDTTITGDHQDLRLYAKWIPEVVVRTVTLDLFGGQIDGGSELTISPGNKIGGLPVPTAGGAVFDNWYADEERTQPWDFDTTVDSDMTLYAGWSMNLTDWEYDDSTYVDTVLLKRYAGTNPNVIILAEDDATGKKIVLRDPTPYDVTSPLFSNMLGLITNVYLEEGVQFKDNNMEHAFSGMTELRSVNIIPEGTTNLARAFMDCSKMVKSPRIPDSVTNMESTFMLCSNLNEAPAIPESVTELYRTFQDSGIIETPYLHDGIVSINWAFVNCRELQYVTNLPDGLVDMTRAFNGTKIGFQDDDFSLTIPSTVEYMAFAFSLCTELRGTLIFNNQIEFESDYNSVLSETSLNVPDGAGVLLLAGPGSTPEFVVSLYNSSDTLHNKIRIPAEYITR